MFETATESVWNSSEENIWTWETGNNRRMKKNSYSGVSSFVLLVLHFFVFLFFTGATALCGSWPSSWFHNSKIFQDETVSLTTNPQSGEPGTTVHLAPYPFTYLTWVDLREVQTCSPTFTRRLKLNIPKISLNINLSGKVIRQNLSRLYECGLHIDLAGSQTMSLNSRLFGQTP
jgi:hypothetical protein